jgi:anti-sigma regulatory factor (Ser/Thr protein kinase)
MDRPLLTASFVADSSAPAEARRLVRALDVPDEDRLEDAVLLTSEIVSNAVKHPRKDDVAQVKLLAVRRGNVLRVEVANRRDPREIGAQDERPGWDLQRAEPAGPSGWGLQLVDRLAARWGTVHEPSRTIVWFEVALGPGDG